MRIKDAMLSSMTSVGGIRRACLSTLRNLQFVVLFGLLTLPSLIRGQGPIAEMAHKSWTARDGVPGNILDSALGSDGLLWLATDDGLFRFDGISFEPFVPRPGNALQSERVRNLYAAPDGSMWITLLGGVSRIKSGLVTNFTTQNGLGSGEVRSVVMDKRTTVWLGGTEGLYELHGSEIRHVGLTDGVPVGEVFQLAIDAQDSLWISLRDSILVRPAGKTQFQLATRFASGGEAACFPVLPDGVRCLDNRGWRKHLRYKDGAVVQTNDLANPLVHSFHSMKDGSLWMTTDGAGILRVTENLLTSRVPESLTETFDTRKGLTSNLTFKIIEDPEGSIWVFTHRGFDQFRPRVVRAVETPPADSVALLHGSPGSQTIVGVDRLLEVTNGHLTELTRPFTKGVQSLYRADDGTIWVGTDKKLLRFANGKLTEQAMPPGILGPELNVQTICEDAQHGIWIAVRRNGTFRLYQGAWSRKGGKSDLPSSPAVSSMRDGSGNVWFGYFDGRIASLSASGQVHVFGPAEGLQVGTVKAFSQVNGDLIVGGDNGVAMLHGGRFLSLTLQGVSSLRGVTGLVLASDGDLWVNANTGIYRLPKVSLMESLVDSGRKVKFEVFDHHDGVEDLPSPTAGLDSALQGVDGKLYFGTRTELNWIEPQNIPRNAHPPTVTIDKVSSDLVTTLWPAAAITLEPNPQNIQIHYAAGSLLIPDKVRFRHLLQNYDKDWVDAGGLREANYSHLPPGRYTFRVVAANDNNVWNDEGAAVTFVVPATFTQTIWFKLAIVACLAALITYGFSLRLAKVRKRLYERMSERMAERERIARDLHDTFFQSIQGLLLRFNTGLSQLGKDEPARMLFEETLRQSDQVMLEGRELVLDLRSEPGEMMDLAQALSAQGEELKKATDLEFKVIVNGIARDLTPFVWEEAYRVGKEALANAFQHSQGTLIEVDISYDKSTLTMRVRDDGVGIEAPVLEAGGRQNHWGLPGMRERAAKVGSVLTIWSRKNAGTEIELRIPAAIAYRRDGAKRFSAKEMRDISRKETI